MFDSVNIVAVVGTTLFMMASATVWFSPMLFGKQWLKSLRATEEEIEATRENMTKYMITNFLLYLLALYVLAQIVHAVSLLKTDLLNTSLTISIFMVAIIGSTALWEGKKRVNFLVNAGFYGYFIVVGMFMIAYWPW